MRAESTLDHDRRDLQHPDGSKTLVWVRRGRIRLAVLGAAAALAAGGAAAGDTAFGAGDPGQAPSPASAPAEQA